MGSAANRDADHVDVGAANRDDMRSGAFAPFVIGAVEDAAAGDADVLPSASMPAFDDGAAGQVKCLAIGEGDFPGVMQAGGKVDQSPGSAGLDGRGFEWIGEQEQRRLFAVGLDAQFARAEGK